MKPPFHLVTAFTRSIAMALAMLCLLAGAACAQSAAQRNSVPKTAPEPKAAAPKMPTAQGTELDRVDVIVNGDLILDSDVDQERRFAALLPYGEASGQYSRGKAIERLINRDLILQQSRLQAENDISDADATKDLDAFRKAIPTCKELHCDTQEGWDKFLASQGFTERSLLVLWKERMEVLAFIEQRFRMGIKIDPTQIKSYYDNTMLPLYAAQHVAPPPLDSISQRIQEVLLQQQVSSLLDDWLKTLRAQGSVVVMHPGEGAP
jgi:peptidyl-prolyl cis-trans isomerase SurA